MSRRPEVFVRPVSLAEGQRLQKISRTAKDPVKLRRAIVVWASAQGQSVPDIAHLLDVSPDYVRDVIHAFNEQGFGALDPKWSGGAPKTIDEPTRARICAIAGCDPRILRQPFSTWSLAKLCDYLVEHRYVERISWETLRRILRDDGVSWQTTTTWKASNDPDFTAKMTRILDLYDHPPNGGRVLCVDEFGPLNLLPRKGKAWRPVKTPERLRATYTRTQGVRHMFAALDLATGKLTYRIRERKRWREFLGFCKQLRRRWPHERLYLVLDNYGPHTRPEVLAWCQAHDIELVLTPTNASGLNWIESEFAALRYFALGGTDHRSHDEQNTAIGAYIRWHNQRARPNGTSRSTQRSDNPITRSTPPDKPLATSRPKREATPQKAPTPLGRPQQHHRTHPPHGPHYTWVQYTPEDTARPAISTRHRDPLTSGQVPTGDPISTPAQNHSRRCTPLRPPPQSPC
ncbi:transposase [Saccharopolyspora erythraea NRRL 2338]|uniref:Tc1-like transposase DDE domain-containing protein n=2 Tax=Saccharopolyspora erythraea TaxID=1836 RepID=A0ABN1CUV1_SACER|nr:IS630 family transposase [Saccharopolyspora erythraea]PFG98017.1 transposase [Saccharopolyspora erythraea NRRL 2338]